MSEHDARPAWMEDELVRDIPREKLDILSKMFEEANQKKLNNGRSPSQKEMLMHFMPLLKQMRASNLSFTPAEIQAAITAIKKHSTEKELEEIEKILKKREQQ